MQPISSYTRADWAPAIERCSRQLAAIACWLYAAGYCCGLWLHHLNDRIAGISVPPEPVAPPAPHPPRPVLLGPPAAAPAAAVGTAKRAASSRRRKSSLPPTPTPSRKRSSAKAKSTTAAKR